MIIAMDNFGDTYMSLLQCNVNQDVFCLYLRHLAAQLDIDRPEWKENTILQLDGAKYHTTPKVK